MLSANLISQSVRNIATMLSPQKNPCRVRVLDCAAATSSCYRYDPYLSKVLASPMKSAPSPTNFAPIPVEPIAPVEAQRNSLFTRAAEPIQRKSFLAAAEKPTMAAPTPVAMERKHSAAELARTHYAIIFFKHDSATYLAPFRVKIGDHVIVEGDRGVDLGIIHDITTETPSYPVPMKIVRRATTGDMEAFSQKAKKEMQVTAQVQALSRNLNLDIKVVDTEFQFDNNKLTVYFESTSGHIDFRKLQRGLFREHRCRIWLSNMAEVEYNAKLQATRRTR
jgi:hypothetical protein